MALSLIWDGDLKFHSGDGGPAINLDSDDPNVVSPMQGLAYSLMGCMAMDVAHILKKGRHDLKSLSVEFSSERASETPKRYTKVHLKFCVGGAVPKDAIERAITTSIETESH
jgi:putative redox protein